jgi:hypothetical protein
MNSFAFVIALSVPTYIHHIDTSLEGEAQAPASGANEPQLNVMAQRHRYWCGRKVQKKEVRFSEAAFKSRVSGPALFVETGNNGAKGAPAISGGAAT